MPETKAPSTMAGTPTGDRPGWRMPGLFALALVLLAGLGACQQPGAEGSATLKTGASPTTGSAAKAAAAKAEPRREPAPARARRHMIATANPLASAAGLDILRSGGSAVDAAIAAQMVLNLVEPQSSGIGGGGFLLYASAKTGEITAYDGRETAPASARPTMFLDDQGKPRQRGEVQAGGLAVGVPGLIAMLEMAHKKHGRLPWATLFEPAIRLAREGFPISKRLNRMVARDNDLKNFAAAARYFLNAQGEAKPVGTMLANPALAETLSLIARKGARAFYEGPIAEDIVGAVQGAPSNPGGMTLDDLKAYQAKKREPVCLFYRVWLVCGMPPPSSGGIATLQILGILQSFDLGKIKPASVEAIHLISEASRLAFADRNAYVADPGFVPVPTAGLLDPGYLGRRAGKISATTAMGKATPGMPAMRTGLAPPSGAPSEGPSTTHISVIDGDGNAVAMTTSIARSFGSRLMVRGFLLNDQLTDFSFKPSDGGGPLANRAEPGKRPRSSMSPTLVFDGQGRVVLTMGSPGGSRIIGYVAETLVAALDWKMNIQEAITLPRFLNRNGMTELESGTKLESLKAALEALGHKVRLGRMTSGLQGIRMSADGLEGGADPRREGVALGD